MDKQCPICLKMYDKDELLDSGICVSCKSEEDLAEQRDG